MKAKPLLGLVILATAGLWALAAGCVAEEEVEQAPTPTPGHRLGAPTSEPCLIGLTPIPASQQLPVTANDIQQGLDGKYFVSDRGDCCPFQEVMREDFGDGEWVLLGNSSCDLYWRYSPSTGEVAEVPVTTPDDLPTATPSGYVGPTPTPPPLAATPKPGRSDGVWPEDIKLGSDGKHSRADTGDGCTYAQVSKFTDPTGEWIYLQSPTCEPDFIFSPATGETQFILPSFRLGSDGKYLKVDHVGCNYSEVSRFTEDGHEWVRLESPTHCHDAILFAPTLGVERNLLPPSPTPSPTATPPVEGVPRSDRPSPSEIKLGSDGKYFIPDRGDGCPWEEGSRLTLTDGTLLVVLHTECDVRYSWTYYPETGDVSPLIP